MKKVLMGHNFDRKGMASLDGKFEVIYPEGKIFSKEEVLDHLGDVEVFVPNFTFQTGKDIIDAGKKLQLIANYGVGFNNIDIKYATEKGITVTNTPQSVLEPTAELCFALIMAAARRIGDYNTRIRQGDKELWDLFSDLGEPLYGRTLGIYGMGRIGQAVARRAVASGMKIIYYNRHQLPADIEKLYNARYVTFETLLKDSDVITLNAPATAETYHLIGEEELKAMKSSAVLVNTARGVLVDEQALANALKSGEIFAAGLDVYENEPHINPDLLALNNVVLTPHSGTKTSTGRIEQEYEVAKNILNFYEGGEINKVN